MGVTVPLYDAPTVTTVGVARRVVGTGLNEAVTQLEAEAICDDGIAVNEKVTDGDTDAVGQWDTVPVPQLEGDTRFVVGSADKVIVPDGQWLTVPVPQLVGDGS